MQPLLEAPKGAKQMWKSEPAFEREESLLPQIDHEAYVAELFRLRAARDQSTSIREWAEWCVEIEEAMGGRPPTRAYDGPHTTPRQKEE